MYVCMYVYRCVLFGTLKKRTGWPNGRQRGTIGSRYVCMYV
jgi:hypothetical protein